MVVCIAFVGFEHIIYLSGDDLFLLCRCHRCHYYDYLASSCVVLTLADIGFVTAYVLQSQHDSIFFSFWSIGNSHDSVLYVCFIKKFYPT